MTSGAGSKVASIAIAIVIVSTLALATPSAAQVEQTPLETGSSDGPCIVVESDDPGVQVDPQNCKDIVTGGLPASPLAAAL